MKYIFQIFGVFILIVGSFIYSDKVSMASKNSDSLLLEIREKSDNYKILPSEPIINENTIIPGVNGVEVDIDKSYKQMREVGYFDENLLVYKTIEIEYPLNKNLDKFIISANEDKKAVALIFKISNNDNIDKIIKVLNKKDVKGSFFVTSIYLEKNSELLFALLKEGNTIGALSDDYASSDAIWMKTIITNIGEQNSYCYLESKNVKTLKTCAFQGSRTIIPTSVINTSPLVNVRENLKSGAMLSFEVNKKLEYELENIINYIQSKGYSIKSLESLLNE